MADSPGDLLALADWKRRVFDLYRRVRDEPDPAAAARLWRTTRDELFARHPQSPLPPDARADFAGLPYFDHDPALRVLAAVVPAEPQAIDIGSSGEAPIRFTRFARAEFTLAGAITGSTSSGSRATAAASTSRSPTRRAARRPTARAATCSTR